jgi:hypothetical protein
MLRRKKSYGSNMRHLMIMHLIIMLVCSICSCSTEDRMHSVAIKKPLSDANTESVNERLASELVRHGRLLLRSGRYGAALDSTALAAFLSGNARHIALASEYKSRLSNVIKQMNNRALDARNAGDRRESDRMEDIVDAFERQPEVR